MGKLNDSDQYPILRMHASFARRLYKDGLKCEEYLNLVKNKKYRIAFLKFRTSSYTLAIESDSHTNYMTPPKKHAGHATK